MKLIHIFLFVPKSGQLRIAISGTDLQTTSMFLLLFIYNAYRALDLIKNISHKLKRHHISASCAFFPDSIIGFVRRCVDCLPLRGRTTSEYFAPGARSFELELSANMAFRNLVFSKLHPRTIPAWLARTKIIVTSTNGSAKCEMSPWEESFYYFISNHGRMSFVAGELGKLQIYKKKKQKASFF